MGRGYLIGCNNCVNDEDINNYWKEDIKRAGTIFYIHTGGVMMCFCKEQIEKIYGAFKKNKSENRLLAGGDPPDEFYKRIKSATGNNVIDKIIYEKINMGYEFTEILGDLPYYCENCKKIFTNFYFQMEKINELYLPNYECEKCDSILEPVYPLWDKSGGGTWADDLEKINFKYFIYYENGLIKMKSNINEVQLECDHCGNNNFSIMSCIFAD